MSVKIFYAKRKPQEETTRHENTRVGSKAFLRFCVVLCCGPLPCKYYSYKILKNSETMFTNLFPRHVLFIDS